MTDIYLGIYLEIETKKVKQKTRVYYDESGKITTHKFNPDNGKENESEIITEEDIEIIDGYFEDSDELYSDSVVFYYPEWSANSNNKFTTLIVDDDKKFGQHLNDNEPHNIEFKKFTNISQIITEFEKKYKKYLDYIEDKGHKFEIKYGVVTYDD